ncbi:cytochrome P450 [Lasiosphaeris hirsuta]|uniref:Cytochrome P450 n=1 Tax=Lasiosphaeris hirsuta TaxID=260670 RepID=A0AA39ZRU1_9PEZI|nr:cytochrome P450 [Lasiosphaeris hirsuta]
MELFKHIVAFLRNTASLLSRFEIPPGLAGALAAIGFATLIGWQITAWATSPLRTFPGPFLAGWTNLWRLYTAWSGRYPLKMLELHKKYGPVVRIGPNTLVLDYPELIRVIYGTDGKYPKASPPTSRHPTEFYRSSSAVVNGKLHYTLFAEPDHDEHSRVKKPIAKYYTTGATLAVEPHMDRAIAEFCEQLDSRFVSGPSGTKQCDLWKWSLYLAWDLSSAIIFSRRFGYLNKGCDFDSTIKLSEQIGRYFPLVAQMPFLDFWLDKNPIVKIGPAPFTGLMRLAVDGLAARGQGKDKDFDPEIPDYLQHFIDSKSLHPEVVHDGTVIAYTMVQIIAGADSSAVTISVILHYAMKHPSVFHRLVQEIRQADFNIAQPVPYSAARQLPYLDAVCREAARLQPILGSQLERYVPAEGLALPNGSFVPAGTAVGINPYITGRNKDVFGEDADEFRPERWLQAPGEDETAFTLRLRKQTAADLSFGAGSRICLGKNIGVAETYKVVATLLNRYDIELVEPEREWAIIGAYMRRPTSLLVNLKMRDV